MLEVKGSLKDLNKYSDTLVQISRSTLVNKNKIRRRYKSLNNFKNMHDIIQYNKIDTRLLYVILQYFIGHQ